MSRRKIRTTSQIRFDPEKPQILDKAPSTPKVSNMRSTMRDRLLSTIPEKEGDRSSASVSSFRVGAIKEHLSSLKSKLKKAPTLERTAEVSRDRLSSQWENLMRKFSQDSKFIKKCRLSQIVPVSRERDTQQFITGSTYTGTWDILGMNGHGTFTFPNGVVYEGEFSDSCFHGNGVLKYPNGVKLIGKWENGVMKSRTLVFGDGVEYAEDGWDYCHMPDRRFMIEHETALKPGTKSFMTADQPPKPIPLGFYDAGDGFFDPKSKAIVKYDCITDIVRFLSAKGKEWVQETCRTNPDVPVGPREDFYEKWMDPTPDDLSRGTSLSTMEPIDIDDIYNQSKLSASTVRLGRRPFIKFDPQAYHSAASLNLPPKKYSDS